MATKKNDTDTPDPANGNPAEVFKPAWLDGLVYVGTKVERVKDKTGERKVRKRVERPLAVGDILSWRIDGGQVVLVTADGKKYRVKR